MDVKQLEGFLVRAREKVGWESADETTLPDGTKVLGPYKETPLRYTDSYQADEFDQFVGREEITNNGTLVWIREYQGGVVGSVDAVDTETLFGALRTAMKNFPRDRPFKRGPDVTDMLDHRYIYSDSCTGDMTSFQGKEQVFERGNLVHVVTYGGRIVA